MIGPFTKSNMASCFRNKKDYFYIVVFAIVSLLLLMANPGYFSHDELQKLDHVKEFGLKNYIDTYVALQQGSSFGVPVRPFSFLVQGILALFMEEYTVVVHLIAVLTHAAVGCLLYAACSRFGMNRALSLTIACVFIVNPLGTLATGWSAALMDRWYVAFGVAAFICADKYIRENKSAWSLFALFVCSSLSMLSKETAVILPALIGLILLMDMSLIREKRFWKAVVVWCLPIALFMLYRLPALFASFGNPDVSAYKASLTNIPEGLLVYSAYPFLTSIAEAGNWVFANTVQMVLAVVMHCLICFALLWVRGVKVALIYVCGYFLFLAPVLLIPIRASHYLYGSSIVLSIAIGYLIFQGSKGFNVPRLVGLVALLLMLIHTAINQNFVYSLGRCMNVALISTESAYASSNKPKKVNFQAEPGATEHVLHRLYTGRNRIANSYPLELSVSKFGEVLPDDVLVLKMNSSCIVHYN